MNDQTTLKCANRAGYDKTGCDKTGFDKTGRVIKVSMKGIPVVTQGIWAEMGARARQPSTVFRPYPILPDAN